MDLDLSPRTIGRAAKELTFSVERPLTAVDIAGLSVERGTKPSRIKRLRDSHHAVARLIAQGESNDQIALLTGYTPSRISVLKGDPSFEELIAHYKERVDSIAEGVWSDVQTKMATLHGDALDEIAGRLEEAPETLATETLLDVVKVTADRTGHGPQTKSTNVNVNISYAERIRAGRERVAKLVGAPALASPPVPGEKGADALPAPSVKEDAA